MSRYNVLFEGDSPKALDKVREKIREFEYTDASCDIIRDSLKLEEGEETFITCSTRILSNFGMTRGGPLKDINETDVLHRCWELIGDQVLEIHNKAVKSGSRDRYLLAITDSEREELCAKVWSITKLLLPLTMGRTSWGLVGASKILFLYCLKLFCPSTIACG